MNVDSSDKFWKPAKPANAQATPGPNFILPAVTAALTALQTIVVAGFGYTLTGKLELTLKERQLTVTNVTAMAALPLADRWRAGRLSEPAYSLERQRGDGMLT